MASPPNVASASPELAAAERMHGGRRAAMASVPQVPRAGAASGLAGEAASRNREPDPFGRGFTVA